MAATTSMTLRFFGAGGAFSRRYGTTCSMLTTPSGLRWLVDCGRQAPDQLHEARIRWHEIHGQIVTHVHGDHVFGLEDFAFRRYYEPYGDVPPVRFGGPKPKLMAHAAIRGELWETLAPALRYLPDDPAGPAAGTLSHYFELVEPTEVEPPGSNPWSHAERFAADEIQLTARECPHVPGKPSTALEIQVAESGRIAWWSGDSIVDAKRLVEIEPRTTVYFHDCTFIEFEGQVHGAFSDLAQLPEQVRRKMVLMHHEDDIERHRAQAESLGFRLALPQQVYDLVTGQRIK